MQELGEAIAKFPADAVALNNAPCFSRMRNMREAVDAMRRAVRVLPNRLVMRSNLAVYANYAGDFRTAEQEVAAVQEPGDLILIAGAFAEFGQGRLGEAKKPSGGLGPISARGTSSSLAGLGDLALYEGRFEMPWRFPARRRRGSGGEESRKSSTKADVSRVCATTARPEGPRGSHAEKALATSPVCDPVLVARIFVEGTRHPRPARLLRVSRPNSRWSRRLTARSSRAKSR